MLTLNQFQATRLNCTEKPNSSRLSGEHKDGIYECASCGVNLFDSKAKYNAGYGWPSFYHPIEPNAISHEKDKCQPPPGWVPNLPRVEVHCSRCGAHLGHRFNTNPKPDGYRYFINGIALNFVHIINYFKWMLQKHWIIQNTIWRLFMKFQLKYIPGKFLKTKDINLIWCLTNVRRINTLNYSTRFFLDTWWS